MHYRPHVGVECINKKLEQPVQGITWWQHDYNTYDALSDYLDGSKLFSPQDHWVIDHLFTYAHQATNHIFILMFVKKKHILKSDNRCIIQ